MISPPSGCLMRPGADPCLPFIVAHLEHTSGRLHLSPEHSDPDGEARFSDRHHLACVARRIALDSCLSISQVAKLRPELRKLPDERPLQTLFPLQDHPGHRDEIGGRMGDTVIVKPSSHRSNFLLIIFFSSSSSQCSIYPGAGSALTASYEASPDPRLRIILPDLEHAPAA